MIIISVVLSMVATAYHFPPQPSIRSPKTSGHLTEVKKGFGTALRLAGIAHPSTESAFTRVVIPPC